MDDDDQPESDDNHLAIGIALGVPMGVVLSLLLDSWAMVGVGIALGAAFGAVPASAWSRKKDEPDDALD